MLGRVYHKIQGCQQYLQQKLAWADQRQKAELRTRLVSVLKDQASDKVFQTHFAKFMLQGKFFLVGR